VTPPEELTDIRLAGRLALRLVHDLNNVAAIVAGHVYLLRSSGEPLEEGLDAIERVAAQLERTTRSLSALAALGEEPLVSFDLNEVAEESRRDPPALAGAIQMRLESGIPRVNGRRGEVLGAVKALIANAAEAGPAPLPIVVRTRRDEPGAVVLEVIDAGAGVPAGIEKRVFDPLFTTRGQKGRGFGLTLAAAVAALHGGSCTIVTAPEGGTAAVLRLPVS